MSFLNLKNTSTVLMNRQDIKVSVWEHFTEGFSSET